MKTKTNFIGRINPFTGQPKMKPAAYTDPAALKIGNDDLPLQRSQPINKYDQVFDKMTFGQCVICTPDDVGKVSGAMRKYLSRSKTGGTVKTVLHYPADKMGRVWMLKKEDASKKAAA